MRRMIPLLVAVVLLAGTVWGISGCGGPQLGATQEMLVDEPLTSAAVTEVNLALGEGKLVVAPGALGLVSGTITYNVTEWRPKISRTDDSVAIRQGSTKGPSGEGDIVNQWDLELGQAPMRLKIEAGAYVGVLDLSGLSLQGLDVEDGAAQCQVVFNLPNPSQMELLRYRTGASTVSLRGLANANLAALEFVGAAGTYSLDFSGQLRSDTVAEVTVAGGTLRIEVPGTTRLEARIKNTTAEVASEGAWTIDGTTYRTPALVSDADGKTLTIEVEMTAGSATLVCK